MQTDRRTLIAGTTALALATPSAASAAAPAVDRTAWDEAKAQLAAADAEYEAYKKLVHDPAAATEEAFEEALGLVFRQPDGSVTPGYYETRRKLREEHGTAHVIPDDVSDHIDALCARYADADTALMQVPAPDLPALRWKLDRLLSLEHTSDEDGGCTPAWSATYARQTLEDMARLLPKAR